MKCKIFLLLLHSITMILGLKSRQNFGIVLDASIDMGEIRFKQSLDFIEKMVQHLSISPSTTRIAVATISNSFQLQIMLTENINREHFTYKLKKIRCCRGKSRAKLLRKATRLLDNDTFSDRKIDRFLFFIGDKYCKELPHVKFKRRRSSKEIVIFTTMNERYISKYCPMSLICIDLNSAGSLEQTIGVLNLSKDRITDCRVTGKVFDECGRHCDCVNGTKANCYRIRKEFTQMAKSERRKYIKTYFQLTTEFPFKYRYERFIYIHHKYFCYGIHSKHLFCPWHRYYILQMENLLREIDCSVTLPYWDWSHVGDDPWQRSGIWNDNAYGLGGNGSEANGFCVTSGVFRHPKWKTPFFNDNLDIVLSTLDIYGDLDDVDVLPNLSDCLRRYFDGQLPDSEHVRRALNIKPENFSDFDINLRINYHDTIHNAVGGTMCTHFAGTAPEFFLHHAFLDKIWFMWQQKSNQHKNAFFANSTQKLMGFSHNAKEMIDSHNLPGHVKITYTKFPQKRKRKRDIEDQVDYSDDINTKKGAIFQGIIETATQQTFPSCKRKKSERLRAEYLDKLFSRKKG